MMSSARKGRLLHELKKLEIQPPWGVVCKPKVEDVYDVLCVKMLGPGESPYENGKFELVINIPDVYPYEPPQVKFITPVYHPNIDKGGRICMNILKMPPKGTWFPTIALDILLVSIQNLLANPNPNDPLMFDIANEYKSDIDTFIKKARQHTAKYAV